MLDESWLSRWRAWLCVAGDRAAQGPAAAYADPDAGPWTGPPAAPTTLATLRERMPWVPEDLLVLHQVVGPVCLADVGDGYFVHPAEDLAAVLDHDDGRPDRLVLPEAGEVDVVVFGSDGGGRLYALATAVGGPVYRLQEASYVDGVYGGGIADVTRVGHNLQDFLERLLNAVEAFAVTGTMAEL